MKRNVLKSSALTGIAALVLAFAPLKKGELTDIAKPHLGFYECESATLSGDDLSDEFEYVRLELKTDGAFVLYYRKTGGKERTEKGKYTYDKDKGEITLAAGEGNAIKRSFPLKDGVMDVTLRIGTKTLQMKFKQK